MKELINEFNSFINKWGFDNEKVRTIMIYELLLSLCIVVLLAANFYAFGYCCINLEKDGIKYWHIWTIYAVSIIFILLLYKLT